MSQVSRRLERWVLNRLFAACGAERIALHRAARALSGERHARIEHQAARRLEFQIELAKAIGVRGGRPRSGSSLRAVLRSVLYRVSDLVTGVRAGNAYAACVEATETTLRVYGRALRIRLAGDTRFGIERQYAEIESDRNELRRLPSPTEVF